MEGEQINQIVETVISNLSKVAEVNTIIGKPLVTLDGTTILPISQISFAFVAGGGEYGDKLTERRFKKQMDGTFVGGSGGGATLTPVGFLVVDKNGVKIVDADSDNVISKILDVAKDISKSVKS